MQELNHFHEGELPSELRWNNVWTLCLAGSHAVLKKYWIMKSFLKTI